MRQSTGPDGLVPPPKPPKPNLLELKQRDNQVWMILAVHLPTRRRYVFTMACYDPECAIEHAHLECCKIDTTNGNWLYVSQEMDFDQLVSEWYPSLGADLQAPVKKGGRSATWNGELVNLPVCP